MINYVKQVTNMKLIRFKNDQLGKTSHEHEIKNKKCIT